MNSNAMYEYVERLANLIRTSVRKAGLASGLQPAQMEALHYLSRCNRYSNTPAAVAEFLGLTKGTVSQTLGVLEANDLLEKQHDLQDRRVVHLRLTPAGEQVIQELIPPAMLRTALAGLPGADQAQMEETLTRLLRLLQRANGLKTFGACKSCTHHRLTDGHQRRCGLTQEILSDADAERICREHTPTGGALNP